MNQQSVNKKNFTPAQKIGKESTISFVGMGYGQILRYIFTVILARLVGVTYLGLYSLGNSITTLAIVFAKAGMDVGVMRFISGRNLSEDKERIRNDIASCIKIGLLISILVMIILISISGWLAEDIFRESSLLKTILIVNSLAIPFVTINLIAIHATQGFQLLKYKIFIEYILTPTLLLLSALFIFFVYSAELTVILPFLFTSVVSSFVSIYLLNVVTGLKITKMWKETLSTEILRFSIPIMFTVILGTLLHWLDVIMLGYYTNAETVGLYHPVIRTAGIQNSILLAFSGIFTPMFSKYFASNDKQNMQHIYRLVTRWILTLLAPILIFIILFSKKILLLFGSEYLAASNILILLSIGTSIYALFGISGSTLVVSGHQRLNLLNTFIAAVLNIILNIILIPKHGLAGAAWATFISLSFIAIIRVFETKILLSINPFYIKDIKAIIAGFFTFVIAFYLKPLIMGYHTVITIILAIIGIAVIYLSFIIIFRLDKDDKDFLSSIEFLKNMVLKTRK